jgi:hypothetical protein
MLRDLQRNARTTDRVPPLTNEEARAAITETLERLGSAETLLRDPEATLPRRDATEPRSPARLPDLAVTEPPDDSTRGLPEASADFVTREVIGRGGMGVVRLALQRSLERDVAVKTSGKAERAVRTLVREARITGGLEHPNVVPVHALGVDRDGAPVLVMKRIEGVAWRTLIHDEAHEAWRPLLAGHGDRTRAHIEILAQVSRALVFAHDRGVVHRDVKPQNVMIGRFGEVYLLDWGVAMRLEERATEPQGIVGTPGYLAPEMARGDPRLVGAHTDVYLLGATLFEVLAKKPPHDAPNALGALVAALVGEPPEFPEDAPRELVQLVRSAMARDPADRLESAEAFREGLARYLVSREAERVHEDGRAALRRAEEVIAKEGPTAPDAFRALIEARFALSSTHRIRQDAESRGELDRCLGHLVEREMVLRSPVGARTLVHEMSKPPEGLDERLAALDRSLAEERGAAEERERARREADSSLSLQAMIGTIVLILTLGFLTYSVVSYEYGVDMAGRTALIVWMGPICAFAVVGIYARRQVMANVTTRRLSAFLAVALTTPFVVTMVGVFCAVPMHQRSAFSWVASAGVALVGELGILRRLWLCVIAYLMGTVAVLLHPDRAFVFIVQALVIVSTAVFFIRSLMLHAEQSRVAPTAG